MANKKKILFLVPYPLHRAPSQRFRVEAFFPLLEEHNMEYRVASFINEKTWNVLYNKSSVLQKAWGVMMGFMKRLYTTLFIVPRYDYVFVHREASPVGPPFSEFIAARIFRCRMIYDFDDAIWMSNTVTPNPVVDWVRAFWKVRSVCRWSRTVSGGNEYLCQYARKYNNNVVLMPTVVDTEKRYGVVKQHRQDKKITIGWTGSHTTMTYLSMMYPVLKKLEEKYDFDFLVISNKKPDYDLRSLRYMPWQEGTEIEDLLQVDIGIMPMFQDPFSEGKCGFKIIQYLALGIPALASPVGVNKTILEHGVNGFLCNGEEDWTRYLSMLLEDASLRNRFGEEGRKKIVAQYSIAAVSDRFLGLFNT